MSRSNSLAEGNSKLRSDIARLQTALKDVDLSHSPIGGQKKQRNFVGRQRETVSKRLLDRLNYSGLCYDKAALKLNLDGFKATRKTKPVVDKKKAKPATILSDAISNYSKSTRALDESIKSQDATLDGSLARRRRRVSFEGDSDPFEITDISNSLPKSTTAKSSSKAAVMPSQNRTLEDSFESYYESEEENISRDGKAQLSFVEYKLDHEKGTRRKDRELLLKEIDILRQENLQLKAQLTKSSRKKTGKSKVRKNKRDISPFGRREAKRLQ